ncbi:hypothetical protein ACHAXT_012341, partial [Thalassiosira profunda]
MEDGSSSLEESLLSSSEEGGPSKAPVVDDIGASARSAARAARPSVASCLALPEDETTGVELDVYNMFYISDAWSQPFFYAICVLVMKMALYILLIVDLLIDPDAYPFERNTKEVEVKLIVKLAQLFLIPVAILVQEELRVSFFVFGNLQYSPGITKRHPGATKWKWYTANSARFADGVLFLFTNTYLMLVTVNLLSIFLNFAALMFLQQIDNVALQVCSD